MLLRIAQVNSDFLAPHSSPLPHAANSPSAESHKQADKQSVND
ncbi:hypothetical protein WZ342_2285 [Enterococcus faecalis]|nr:hypothetical protein WZ342_2285 [Enterococcus faecalis]